MNEFVVILSEKDRDALAGIRTLANVEAATFVADNTPQIWLRRIFSKNKPPVDIQKLPIQSIFVLKNGLLFPIGGLTPLSKLPNLRWQLLADFIPIELPKSALPAIVEATTAARLVVSEHQQKGVALLTHFEEWHKYVENAPEIRLRRLQFAVSQKGQVLVMGDVLPPIRGQVFWQDEQILLPCGVAFEWAITARLLSKKYKLEKKAFLLFDMMPTRTLVETLPQRIDLDSFVDCTRSAVRLTQQNNRWIESQK